MKTQYTEEVRAYNRRKDMVKKRCACAVCRKEIDWNESTCVGFGVYMCLKCRIKTA